MRGKIMDLFHIQHDLIANHTPDAWYVIPCDGPVFRERWDYGSGPNGSFIAIAGEHSTQAVHRAEPFLTLAWGLDVDPNDDRRERSFPWADENFPDPTVHLFWADFFWAGALIDRVQLAGVDGHRGVIPLPDGKHQISTYELAVADVIHSLGSYPDDYAPVELTRRMGFAESRDIARHGAGSD